MFNYLEARLGSMTDAALERLLNGFPRWRTEGTWPVFRSVDPPCIAFTAFSDTAGAITLVVLGACHEFPANDEEAWWKSVVRPRVMAI